MRKQVYTTLIFILCLHQAICQRIPPKNDTPKKIKSWRCYPLYQDSKIGLSYGALERMPGVQINHYAVYYNLHLSSNIEWRFPTHTARYLSAEFIKHNLYNYGDYDFGVFGGHKKLRSNQHLEVTQFYGGPAFFYWHRGIMLAYARQTVNRSEYTRQANGVMLQVYTEFFDRLDVTLSTIYWFDELQYSIKVKGDIYQSSVFVGVGLERLENWKEISFSILYRYK